MAATSYHPHPAKQALLDQIAATFAELHQTYGEPSVHSLDSITTAECQYDLGTYGIYLVGNLVDPAVYEFNLLQLSRELYTIIFNINFNPATATLQNLIDQPNPEFATELERIQSKYRGHFTYEGEFVLAALASFWNSSHGFGNSNFRFVYLQYLEADPRFQIDGISKPIEFGYNPIHRIDLRLLAPYPQLWNLLRSLYPGGRPMVSWDSQKVRFQDTGIINKIGASKISKSTRPGMTKRHHDIYTYGNSQGGRSFELSPGSIQTNRYPGQEMDRLQAMLIFQAPEAIALGYVIFSNHPRIRELLRAYFGKEKTNFADVEDEYLNPILDRYWRAPQEGFVMWEMSTVHYEGLPIGNNSLRTFGGMKETPESLRAFSFRAVIGTHTPIGLTERGLRELAYLSENGWLPEIYKHKHQNDGTPIQQNLVNAKTTQYLKPRTMGAAEAAILEATIESYTPEIIDAYVAELPSIIREMYGLYD